MKEKICPAFLRTIKSGVWIGQTDFGGSLIERKDLFFRFKSHGRVSISSVSSDGDRMGGLLPHAMQNTVSGN